MRMFASACPRRPESIVRKVEIMRTMQKTRLMRRSPTLTCIFVVGLNVCGCHTHTLDVSWRSELAEERPERRCATATARVVRKALNVGAILRWHVCWGTWGRPVIFDGALAHCVLQDNRSLSQKGQGKSRARGDRSDEGDDGTPTPEPLQRAQHWAQQART